MRLTRETRASTYFQFRLDATNVCVHFFKKISAFYWWNDVFFVASWNSNWDDTYINRKFLIFLSISLAYFKFNEEKKKQSLTWDASLHHFGCWYFFTPFDRYQNMKCLTEFRLYVNWMSATEIAANRPCGVIYWSFRTPI